MLARCRPSFFFCGWPLRRAGKKAVLKAALAKFAAFNDEVAVVPAAAPTDTAGLGASLQTALENALGKKKEFVSVDMADKLKSLLGTGRFLPPRNMATNKCGEQGLCLSRARCA